MLTITFGTSGWRGLLAEDFTFPNVRAVTQAIAEHLRQSASTAPVIVAHDTRFLGEEFSRAVAEVLAGNEIPVVRSQRPLPTPAVAWEILHRRAAAAINITASHNPYPWNGLKFSPASAGPALPETTTAIERTANAILRDPGRIKRASAAQYDGLVTESVLGDAYREQLKRLVDLSVLRGADMTVAVDPLYGTGAGFLDDFLRAAGVTIFVDHVTRDPYFGGGRPEPEGHSLLPLIERVRAHGAALGLATDCDADRFGIVDSDGTFVSPNEVLSLLVGYLAETRNWRGKRVGRSVATTHLFDAAAREQGLEVVETPVGFKYLGNLLIQGEIVMAAEESGGLAMSGHVPDKDGVLACLLVAEMVARRGQSLRAQLRALFGRVGPCHSTRRDLNWTGGQAALDERLKGIGAQLAGRRIERVVAIDGKKFILDDGSWVLVRASGTEPIIRVYAEAAEESRVAAVLAAFTDLLGIAAAPPHH